MQVTVPNWWASNIKMLGFEVQALATRRSLHGPVIHPGEFIQPQSWFLPPVPRPGWRRVVNCGSTLRARSQTTHGHHHRSQMPRAQLAPQAFIWTGENPLLEPIGIHIVANTTQVNPQLTTMAPLWEQPQPQRYSEVQCPCNLTLTSGHFLGDNWSKLDQLWNLERNWLKLLPFKAVHPYLQLLRPPWTVGLQERFAAASRPVPGLGAGTLELFKDPALSLSSKAAQHIHRPRGWKA